MKLTTENVIINEHDTRKAAIELEAGDSLYIKLGVNIVEIRYDILEHRWVIIKNHNVYIVDNEMEPGVNFFNSTEEFLGNIELKYG